MSTQMDTGIYSNEENKCSQIQCNGDYANLAGYGRGGAYSAGAPVPSQAAVQSVVITPSFGGSGFNVLQHNLPYSQLSSSGYFNINNAYPSSGNSCQQYTTALARK